MKRGRFWGEEFEKIMLSEIENKLENINEATFQELCDQIIFRKYKGKIDISAFCRKGSQTGKQKTVKGTPDTFIRLANGNYYFIEITTNISDKDKLKKSVEDCFDQNKSQEIDKIEKIILCFNFKIDQIQIEKINNVVPQQHKNRIAIDSWSIDRLALEITEQELVCDLKAGVFS